MTAPVPVSQLAERVLTGGTLADKLWAPEVVWDAARVAVDRPARAPRLAMAPRAAHAPLPSRAALDQPEARAALLHSFANHELLAIELMAAVLGRFPEAPDGFRRGMLAAMRDEQAHLSLYLQRLDALGLEFGALPLSSFFWDTCADAPTPADFVARLSLVFEQANLDFAATFGAWFAEAGDAASAAVLHRVYTDELRHVRHGLAWHRRFKAPGWSDWDAWVARLQQPLSPSRARGLGYDPARRREVGFDDAFVGQLTRWRRSRGRPPAVWWMNPLCEVEATGQTPPQRLRSLEADLALLPVALAAEDDVVLTPRPISEAWREAWLAAGLPLPELRAVDPEAPLTPAAVGHDPVGRLEPWGWSPAARQRAAGLRPVAEAPPSSSTAVLRKDWSHPARAALLAAVHDDLGDRAAPPSVAGGVARDLDALQGAASALLATHDRVVVKAPLGTAGRGAVRLASWPPPPGTATWLSRTLSSQGAVVVEPWLDRIADLSLHLHLDPDGACRVLGWTPFFTDPSGRFLGAWAGDGLRPLPQAAKRLLCGDGRDPRLLDRVGVQTAATIGGALRDAGYVGPIGVDALLYRDRSGGLRLHAGVEVNARWTMGRVARHLSVHVERGRPAVLVLSAGGEAAGGDPGALPPTVHRSPRGLRSAAVALTDPASPARHRAWFLVGEPARRALEGGRGAPSGPRAATASLAHPPKSGIPTS